MSDPFSDIVFKDHDGMRYAASRFPLRCCGHPCTFNVLRTSPPGKYVVVTEDDPSLALCPPPVPVGEDRYWPVHEDAGEGVVFYQRVRPLDNVEKYGGAYDPF